jgi:hypothetical protein
MGDEMARYGEYGTPRQRDKFGGINWGAAFSGWLVAVGIGASAAPGVCRRHRPPPGGMAGA